MPYQLAAERRIRGLELALGFLQRGPAGAFRLAIDGVIGVSPVAGLLQRSSRPEQGATNERISELASLSMLALMTTCCVALPVTYAQTRMMMGMPFQPRVAARK